MPIVLDGTNGVVLDGSAGIIVNENVKTANHTAEIADLGKVITMNNTSSATVTIPADSTTNFPLGSIIRICRINTGSVTLAAAGGVTLSRTGNFAQNEEIYLRKRAANTWIVVDQPRDPSGTGGSFSIGGGNGINTFTTTGASTFTIS
jgi:hypothetical protein